MKVTFMWQQNQMRFASFCTMYQNLSSHLQDIAATTYEKRPDFLSDGSEFHMMKITVTQTFRNHFY